MIMTDLHPGALEDCDGGLLYDPMAIKDFSDSLLQIGLYERITVLSVFSTDPTHFEPKPL